MSKENQRSLSLEPGSQGPTGDLQSYVSNLLGRKVSLVPVHVDTKVTFIFAGPGKGKRYLDSVLEGAEERFGMCFYRPSCFVF